MRDKINEMVHPIDNGKVITDEVIVSCCGCNEEVRITRDEANEWTDTAGVMCHECEERLDIYPNLCYYIPSC